MDEVVGWVGEYRELIFNGRQAPHRSGNASADAPADQVGIIAREVAVAQGGERLLGEVARQTGHGRVAGLVLCCAQQVLRLIVKLVADQGVEVYPIHLRGVVLHHQQVRRIVFEGYRGLCLGGQRKGDQAQRTGFRTVHLIEVERHSRALGGLCQAVAVGIRPFIERQDEGAPFEFSGIGQGKLYISGEIAFAFGYEEDITVCRRVRFVGLPVARTGGNGAQALAILFCEGGIRNHEAEGPQVVVPVKIGCRSHHIVQAAVQSLGFRRKRRGDRLVFDQGITRYRPQHPLAAEHILLCGIVDADLQRHVFLGGGTRILYIGQEADGFYLAERGGEVRRDGIEVIDPQVILFLGTDFHIVHDPEIIIPGIDKFHDKAIGIGCVAQANRDERIGGGGVGRQVFVDDSGVPFYAAIDRPKDGIIAVELAGRLKKAQLVAGRPFAAQADHRRNQLAELYSRAVPAAQGSTALRARVIEKVGRKHHSAVAGRRGVQDAPAATGGRRSRVGVPGPEISFGLHLSASAGYIVHLPSVEATCKIPLSRLVAPHDVALQGVGVGKRDGAYPHL